LRRIPQIQNYCNRWCERCPLAHRCGVFQVRNSKLEDLSILAEGSEINAAEETQNPFADLNLRESEELQEIKRIQEQLPPLDLNINPLMQNFREWNSFYQDLLAWLEAELLKPWLDMPILRQQKDQEIDNAFSVLNWYKDFIGPKLSRALGGKHEFVEGLELEQSDWNGSAKIILLAVKDVSLSTEKLLHYFGENEQSLIRFWQLTENFKTAIQHDFPYAMHFTRPGFDTLGLQHNLGLQ
jgi:hypothetical protein